MCTDSPLASENTSRPWRDDERGGIAVMVGLFALIFASVTWAVLAAAQRHTVGRQLYNVADSLALAGAAMVLEQGAEGDTVRNWDQLVAMVGKPNAPGQAFSASARVMPDKDATRERRLVEVTVEADHDSSLGTQHYKIVSYAYVFEKLEQEDERRAVVLVLDASGSMARGRGQSARNKKDLWGMLQEVVTEFVALHLPVRTGMLVFNSDLQLHVLPHRKYICFDDEDLLVVPGRKICDVEQLTKDQQKDHWRRWCGASERPDDPKKIDTDNPVTCEHSLKAIEAAMGQVKPKGGTNLKEALELAQDLLARSGAPKHTAALITDGNPTRGGILGFLFNERAARIAATNLRKAGSDLHAIETRARKTSSSSDFLQEIAGPGAGREGAPDDEVGPFRTDVCPGKGGEQSEASEGDNGFYHAVSRMDEVGEVLDGLVNAVCAYGPLNLRQGEPVGVYLLLGAEEKKLELCKDYHLRGGLLMLNKQACQDLGKGAGNRLMIRWGRPRLTSGPGGP